MKKVFFILTMSFCVFALSAQNQTVTLRFTGEKADSTYQQLDSISINNFSKSWNEILYYPDTVLEVTVGAYDSTGVNEYESSGQTDLGQNYPNPFNGRTNVSVSLPKSGKVNITVYDINGKLYASYQNYLEVGYYLFDLILNTPQTYLLSVKTASGNKAIKMINTGNGGSNKIQLKSEKPYLLKSILAPNHSSNQHFDLGDTLQYVGFAKGLTSDVILQQQSEDEDFTLRFGFVDSIRIEYESSFYQNSNIFLPDGQNCGSGCAATSTITINSYNPQGTITSAEDLLYVQLALEHSYLGDLWIRLTCPSGQHATILKSSIYGTSGCAGQVPSSDIGWNASGSSSVMLGLADDTHDGSNICDPTQNPMGNCWNYCWSNASMQGYQYANGSGYIYQSVNHITGVPNPNASSSAQYVDSTDIYNMTQVYHPDVSFSNLVGCPLNGDWTIEIIDGWSADNGYLCGWGLALNPLLLLSDTTVAYMPPTISIDSITNISSISANCYGNVVSDYIIMDHGVCCDTLPYPSISNICTHEGATVDNFRSLITGLTPNTTYYIRPYVTNIIGTIYGNQQIFTTTGLAQPVVTTDSVTNITPNSATCYGIVEFDGYDPNILRGICWSTSTNPTIFDDSISAGNGVGNFSAILTGLSSGTTYYYRAFAMNNQYIAYGNQLSFSIPVSAAPTVVTDSIINVTTISALAYGVVTNNGFSAVTSRGFCWSTSPSPTINDNIVASGSGNGNFNATLIGFSDTTTYYIRAYATNNIGTGYGNELTVTTPSVHCRSIPTVTDIDGNVYRTVQLGSQCWMRDNLRTTHFANNDTIIIGYFGSTILRSEAIAMRYYPGYDSANVPAYGFLYNWRAAMHNAAATNEVPSFVQGICPNGWHLPSYDEWQVLFNYVNSQSRFRCGGVSGKIAKAMSSKTGWSSSSPACNVGNNPSGNDATGFSIMPAGMATYAYLTPENYLGSNVFFWTTTILEQGGYNYIYVPYITTDYGIILSRIYSQTSGFPVRCVHDDFDTTLATVTTNSISNITAVSANCNASVTNYGGAAVTARGVCWSTLPNPTVDSSNYTIDTPNIFGNGTYTATLSNLTPNTVYYVRAYATNCIGTAYGSELSFSTLSVFLPTITTNTVSGIRAKVAFSGGNVTNDGNSIVTARGICWDTIPNPTIGSSNYTVNSSGNGIFTGFMPNLADSTVYFVRAYATNYSGTAYGQQETFTTLKLHLPTLTTDSIDNIRVSSATSGGTVISEGNDSITVSGICWDVNPNPTLDDSYTSIVNEHGNFFFLISELEEGVTYYVRAYATNNAGTGYGDQQVFTTPTLSCPSAPTLTDIDGNVYKTVQIGTQCWMRENLRTTRFANSTIIPYGTSMYATTNYRCYPDNDSSKVALYGYLYNGHAVMNGASTSATQVQGMCPNGWHIPTNNDWTNLGSYVGSQAQCQCDGSSNKIAKALSAISNWNSSSNNCVPGKNIYSNNITGFTAYPTGNINDNTIGVLTGFWAAPMSIYSDARFIYNDSYYFNSHLTSKDYYYPVRCLKN